MPDAGPPPPASSPEPHPLPTASRRRLTLGLFAVAVLLLVVLVAGTATRVIARQNLHAQTEDDAIPTVSVVHPTAPHGDTLVLPARLDAWALAPVYARTNGYLRRYYADIGTQVRAGQVLADIDTPEVDAQLAAAKAALATADAQLDLAATTTQRWSKLLAQNAVSKQDADERRGDFAARQAQRNEALAEVSRLQALTSFKQIVAPFDGVVTSRSTDIGALIVAGTPSSTPLFTVADTSRLRVYVSVPQSYVALIHAGMHAHLAVPEYPGRTFVADLDRSSGSVDPRSGAMLVQLVYDNAAGLLKPGGYADVTFDLPAVYAGGVLIPASSLLFRQEGTGVAIASVDGVVTIHPITIVTDFGTELQISSGARADDWVIDNPPDSIETGDRVRLKPPAGKPSA